MDVVERAGRSQKARDIMMVIARFSKAGVVRERTAIVVGRLGAPAIITRFPKLRATAPDRCAPVRMGASFWRDLCKQPEIHGFGLVALKRKS
jgi:hypothetical protein